MAKETKKSAERMLPHNIEAEQAVLSAMLIKREAIAEAVELVTGDDFYREAHRLAFLAMEELFTAGEPVDIITFAEALRKKEQLDQVGGVSFVTALANFVPTAANIVYHAKIVREKAQLRRLIDAATAIAGDAYEDADDVDAILDEAERKILSVATRHGGDFIPIRDIIMSTIDQIEKRSETEGQVTGISTGFRDLDEQTSGLQPSDLILVAARPAMGKTAFTLNIAD